jgi:Prenyltransferase and squalene oxidase repeat
VVSLLKEIFIPFLLGAQNKDGGWGHRTGLASGIEPTSWAAVALANLPDLEGTQTACARAEKFLRSTQLSNGSWPAVPGQKTGCWVTSPACLALYVLGGADACVAKATAWICRTWPAEGGLWWRFLTALHRPSSETPLDYSLRGWSWTPRTSSWVEPTSYALILLNRLAPSLRPRTAPRRISLAERMLLDRAIPTGGWNCGDPLVYGVLGVPRVGPTVWALLALHRYADTLEIQRGLRWLETVSGALEGPGSLALAHMVLDLFGKPIANFDGRLHSLCSRPTFLQQVNVVAWASLALLGARRWLLDPSQG